MRNLKPDHGEGSLLQNAARRKSALCSGAPCKNSAMSTRHPNACLGCAHAPDAGRAACAAPNAWGRCAKASHFETSYPLTHQFVRQQSGAVEACWAHNPEVGRSKLPSASNILVTSARQKPSTFHFPRNHWQLFVCPISAEDSALDF